ncbi:MAG TPA: hypothetical protein VJJ23_04305 [Candidatus Nanoarchaeia archaeon]|nr:hypothetical protein [Candidatus Nanoarchaeia archaeon]
MPTEYQRPQLIAWIGEIKAFRPAKLKEQEDQFSAFDLEKSVQFIGEDIFSNSLDLVASVYLEPIKIIERASQGITQTNYFEERKKWRYEVLREIVINAERIAVNMKIPYFSLINFLGHKERTLRFSSEQRGVKTSNVDLPKEEGFYSNIRKLGREYGSVLREIQTHSSTPPPSDSIEFILHPTAQFYIPR